MRAALGNMIAFEFTWVSVIVVRTSSLAIMTLTLAEYLVTFFGACVNTDALKKIIAAAAVGKGNNNASVPLMSPL